MRFSMVMIFTFFCNFGLMNIAWGESEFGPDSYISQETIDQAKSYVVKIATGSGIVLPDGIGNILALTAQHNFPVSRSLVDGGFPEISRVDQKRGVFPVSGSTGNGQHLTGIFDFMPALSQVEASMGMARISAANDYTVLTLWGSLGVRKPLKITSPVDGGDVFGIGKLGKGYRVKAGIVMSETHANQLISWVQEYSPKVNSFDPKSEVILVMNTEPGMSGGGIFNEKGELIAIIVRSGKSPDGSLEYTRAVRVDYIREKYHAHLTSLPRTQQFAYPIFPQLVRARCQMRPVGPAFVAAA